MAYKSSFTSRGFRSGLINPYGAEIFLCILASVFFLIASYNKSNFFINFKYYVITFSKPGLMLVAKPFEIANNVFVFFSDFKEIKNLNISLEAENSELKDKINRNNFLEYENFRLKKLLNINEKNYSKKLIGRILINPYKNDDFSFVIDLGKKDGLKINDIVFNEYGMIGRVLELGDFSSKVISLYDQDSVIPVFSMETKQSFFVKGSDNKLLIKHLDGLFSLKHNEVLITTKAAGYFKEGIKVGKVKKTLNEVYVEPFAKLSDTIYVYVLVFEFDKILNF